MKKKKNSFDRLTELALDPFAERDEARRLATGRSAEMVPDALSQEQAESIANGPFVACEACSDPGSDPPPPPVALGTVAPRSAETASGIPTY